MRLKWNLLSAICFFAVVIASPGAHTQATLVLAADQARPGETVMAGLRLRMDPGWHTYWKNSGASGMPTSIDWQIPAGVTAGEILWPLPEKLPEAELTTYIYKDEVVLLVALTLAGDIKPGPLELKAEASWLECAVQCIPGSASVQARLTVGSESKPSTHAPLLAQARKRLPQDGNALGVRAWWDGAAAGDTRQFLLEWNASTGPDEADFFPYASDEFEVLGPTEKIAADPGKIRLRKSVKKLSGDWPSQVSGVVVSGSGAARTGHEVKLSLEPKGGAAGSGSPTKAASSAGPSRPLWEVLISAFVGGLILNFMPCVLPVIALKILGFVNQAKDDPRRARMLGLVYAAGILVSFLVLAGLVIGIKTAGHKVGWGLQFGSPYFLVVMTTLVTLIALNLFGVFEVTLSSRAMGEAANLASRHGAAGAFFNGLLATVLATSCTAPILGAALGYAFAQPPILLALILLTVGVGLAAPYVVLTWQPQWLRFLPKPGAWMERFKVAMGFPMLAAAIWLYNLAVGYYGERTWWLAIFLVFVAVAAWLFGEFFQRHQTGRGLAGVVIVLVLASGYAFALEMNLRWREPAAAGTSASLSHQQPGGLAWSPWSSAAVTEARRQGRPVVVDFTAKWCLTCNTVVKPALESTAVREKMRELNAVALLGDYTHFPDAITEELNRHGRAGVPLVLIYPADESANPIVMPEALTPGMVVKALEQVAKR